jgi:hypothetical protein
MVEPRGDSKSPNHRDGRCAHADIQFLTGKLARSGESLSFCLGLFRSVQEVFLKNRKLVEADLYEPPLTVFGWSRRRCWRLRRLKLAFVVKWESVFSAHAGGST